MKFIQIAAVVLGLGLTSSAFASSGADPALVQKLGEMASVCAEQPNGVFRSHCDALKIVGASAEFNVEGRAITVLVRDNENSDGGDLNDVFVQLDSREVTLARNVLSFGDPVLAVLIVS